MYIWKYTCFILNSSPYRNKEIWSNFVSPFEVVQYTNILFVKQHKPFYDFWSRFFPCFFVAINNPLCLNQNIEPELNANFRKWNLFGRNFRIRPKLWNWTKSIWQPWKEISFCFDVKLFKSSNSKFFIFYELKFKSIKL